MKRQFQRENHSRQERVWKERGNAGPHGSLRSEGKPSRPYEYELGLEFDQASGTAKAFKKVVYNKGVVASQQRDRFRKQFEEHVKSHEFVIQGYRYRFTFTLSTFAEANKLTLATAKTPFRTVAIEAKERYEMAERRVRITVASRFSGQRDFAPTDTWLPSTRLMWQKFLPLSAAKL